MDLIVHYSNTPQLLFDLRLTVRALAEPGSDQEKLTLPSPAQSAQPWSTSARLGTTGMDALLDAYHAGATKKQVADQFKISLSSVKRLLRKHGVQPNK
ncbi:MAG TPA: hypothetical protein VGO07_07045 [Candidatus Saccharimonadales bacterium]|nr:hypothetical protein [Candidatus Saccharimonadales bacterium]